MNIQLSDHFTYGKLLRFTIPSIGMMIFTSIYGIVDGYLTMYTGTYYDDAHKQTLIDTMTILFANTEFLS